jgi:putative nucleotidyltransferase with HDIG domain
MTESSGLLAARAIVHRLQAEGHTAYLVGGCVRDLLLGVAPKDFDVATSARPEAVLELFPRAFGVGAHFGVVLVALLVDGAEMVTEVATYRADGAYSDGRRPDAVEYTGDPKQDVLRRDFTINGMLIDVDRYLETADPRAAVLDWVGGQADLDARLIRAIGDPLRRFTEDKLRMLRAVRFAARFEFAVEPATFAAAQALAPGMGQVSRERVRDELTRMLTEGRAAPALRMLEASGLLEQVLPEVAAMRGVEQPPEWHPEGDVWVHTLLLLEKLPPGCSATLAWGALLHDAGKPPTFTRTDRIRFNGHAEVGTRMAEAICRRLRFSNEETEQILSLVANHMRFGDVARMKESTLKRFFRLPRFAEHLELHRLDSSSSHQRLELYDFAKSRYEAAPAEEVRPALLVRGADLIAAGYRPGAQFRAMLDTAEDAQLEGRIATREEGLALVRELFPLERSRSRAGSEGGRGTPLPPRCP